MDLFDIKKQEGFRSVCLETFRYQYENIEVYRKFVDYLRININEIDTVEKIPFLPIEMFKNHLVFDSSQNLNPVSYTHLDVYKRQNDK